MGDFDKQLARGRSGEKILSKLLQEKGWHVIASYNYTGKDEDKAPKMYCLQQGRVIPDLDTAKDGKRLWVEVKTKYTFAPNPRTKIPQHGIDVRHFNDYKSVEKITGTSIWIAVYEELSGDVLIAKMSDLERHSSWRENGFYNSHGKYTEMKYWDRDAMALFVNMKTGAPPQPSTSIDQMIQPASKGAA